VQLYFWYRRYTQITVQLYLGTGGARCTMVQASAPYLRYGYRRSALTGTLVHGAHPYRVCCGSRGCRAAAISRLRTRPLDARRCAAAARVAAAASAAASLASSSSSSLPPPSIETRRQVTFLKPYVY
jgi:hypothetical protein